jgi:hypothetical protein
MHISIKIKIMKKESGGGNAAVNGSKETDKI